jgi:hypothetical protein
MAGATTVLDWTEAGVGRASNNRRFYPVFIEIDVHDQPADEKYFDLLYGGELRPKAGYEFKGKLTLPSTINGEPVKIVGGFGASSQSNAQTKITHLFVMPDNQITQFADTAFRFCTNLQYVEWPNGLKEISDYAFAQCLALTSMNLSNAKDLVRIGNNAFRQGLAGDEIHVVFPASQIREIGGQVFANNTPGTIADITFGGIGDYLDFTKISYGSQFCRQTNGHANLRYVFYVTADTTAEQIRAFLADSKNASSFEMHTPNEEE